jgi:polysaccharide deacetylase 2 family uncharacterized protein YibQ
MKVKKRSIHQQMEHAETRAKKIGEAIIISARKPK